MKWNDILAIPKRNNMARAYSTLVVLVYQINSANPRRNMFNTCVAACLQLWKESESTAHALLICYPGILFQYVQWSNSRVITNLQNKLRFRPPSWLNRVRINLIYFIFDNKLYLVNQHHNGLYWSAKPLNLALFLRINRNYWRIACKSCQKNFVRGGLKFFVCAGQPLHGVGFPPASPLPC